MLIIDLHEVSSQSWHVDLLLKCDWYPTRDGVGLLESQLLSRVETVGWRRLRNSGGGEGILVAVVWWTCGGCERGGWRRDGEGEESGNMEAYGAITDCYTELGDLERATKYYDQYISRLQSE
ncbi:tetratricopeptide repeat protein [Striga asiatica]|uniref:Tetratricopeptide repeat protein n=1 Tax=Striga asiatica TaxID=4170 RepID=A0A5A7QGR5_STRAF|nr:tetratricopeptide repeat protein [Striga asiatica]